MDEFKQVAETSERLKEALRISGKKQIDLARETGIDKGSISNYLSGRYEPKLAAIKKIALSLDVSEMWLWGYDVPRERPASQKKTDMVASVFDKLLRSPTHLEATKKILAMEPEKVESLLHMIDAFEKK